jgi:hypothetical protein
MWFLHPLQLAPVIVFEAFDRTTFVRDFAAMERQLDLYGVHHGRRPLFEGYFVEAVDDHHTPFMVVWGTARGEVGGGQWSSDDCHYPFPTGGRTGTKPRCNG